MKKTCLFILLAISVSLQAQKKIYYNSSLTYAYKQGSNYALVYITDSNKRLDFYNSGNILVKSQCFSMDFSPKDHITTSYLHGEEQTFFSNGSISKKCYYREGVKEGVELTYFRNGKVSRSCYYKEGKKDGEELTYSDGGQLMGNLIWVNGEKYKGGAVKYLKSGFLKIEIYDHYQTLRSILLDAHGDTSSIYIYYLDNSEKKLSHCLIYSGNRIVDTYKFDPLYREFSLKGDTVKRPHIEFRYKSLEDSLMNHRAFFNGGEVMLQEFVADNLEYPQNCMDYEIEGQILIHFILGREGNIIDIFTNKKGHADLDRSAIVMMLASDGMWIASKKDGKPIISFCRIPINFELEDE